MIEPIHIFYKELPVNENNIFTANITEKNEVENVKFNKSLEYAATGLSINHDIGSELETVTDIDRLNFLSNSIQNLVKEKKEPDLELKISNPETKDIIIPFQRRSATDCPLIKLTFYNTTTKKMKKLSFTIIFSIFQSSVLSGGIRCLILDTLQSSQKTKKS